MDGLGLVGMVACMFISFCLLTGVVLTGLGANGSSPRDLLVRTSTLDSASTVELDEALNSLKNVSGLTLKLVSSLNAKFKAATAAAARVAAVQQQLEDAQRLAREQEEKLRKEVSSLTEELKEPRTEQAKLSEQQHQVEALQEDRKQLQQELGDYFEDVRTATEADRQQLVALLASTPSILKTRHQQIATAPQRGILVSAAGAMHLANTFVNLSVLRKQLGCTLPVAIAYWGEDESIPVATQAFFQEHISDLIFFDSSRVPYPTHQRTVRRKEQISFIEGWKLKVYAVYQAPFQEIVFLDADSMPLLDPASLFSSPEYQRHANIFFPDRFARPPRDELHQLFKHLGLHNPWDEASREKWQPQTDSAQFLLNRQVHSDVLEWLLFLNNHDEFTYRMAFGDKDTFRAAFDLAGKRDSFYQSLHRQAQALLLCTKDGGSVYTWRGYVQLAPSGAAAFIHRSWYSKYDPDSDELRNVSHFTVGLSDERGSVNEQLYDWQGSQVEVVPLETCLWDPLDMVGSLQKCGFSDTDTSLPLPAFPVPEHSALEGSLHAADKAFMQLRVAMAADPSILS